MHLHIIIMYIDFLPMNSIWTATWYAWKLKSWQHGSPQTPRMNELTWCVKPPGASLRVEATESWCAASGLGILQILSSRIVMMQPVLNSPVWWLKDSTGRVILTLQIEMISRIWGSAQPGNFGNFSIFLLIFGWFDFWNNWLLVWPPTSTQVQTTKPHHVLISLMTWNAPSIEIKWLRSKLKWD